MSGLRLSPFLNSNWSVYFYGEILGADFHLDILSLVGAGYRRCGRKSIFYTNFAGRRKKKIFQMLSEKTPILLYQWNVSSKYDFV